MTTYFQPRIPLSFESADGTIVAAMPLADYSWQRGPQAKRIPSVQLVNGNYEYDQLGTAVATKGNVTHTISCAIYDDDPSVIDDTFDALQSALDLIGLGKLWAADRTGARRWAWGRCVAIPGSQWSAGQSTQLGGISMEFRQQSDWYESAATVDTEAIAETPHAYTVANDSGRRILNAVIVLSGTWTGPVEFQNATNGYGWIYDSEGTDSGSSSADQVRFDAGSNRVDRSSDGGLNWVNVYDLLTPNAGQLQQMIFEAGDNDLTVTDGGSPDATIEITWY